MKNFLLLACLLCCQIIVSECSLEEIAEKLEIRFELMTECTDQAGISESELRHYFSKPPVTFKNWRRIDLMGKAGCFLFCIHEKEGLMTGTTIHIEKLTEAISSVIDINSETGARMLKAVKECEESVKGEQNPCEVALNFRECIHGIMNT